MDYKKCQDDDSAAARSGNGRDKFTFRGEDGTATWAYSWDGTRQWLLNKCAAGVQERNDYCAMLLQYDGWEIKDDYPF